VTAEPLPAYRARIRRLRSVVERPADVWLICRMAAWAIVLPLLKRVVRIEMLARVMWSGHPARGEPDTAKILALSRLLTRRTASSPGSCYERSLLAYRFLSRHGAEPRLVAAVKKEDGTVTGHAWVTVGGVPLGESEAIDEFVPVVVYGRGGRREE
jgi:hypothetical protein